MNNKATDNQIEIQWNTDYATGTWNYLRDALEANRYQSVIQALLKYALQGTVLELGCGEGILQSRMDANTYGEYLGIDLSEEAIKKAAHLCDYKTSYQHADMEVFTPANKFDAIVINEVLYYAANPLQLLQRYAHFLHPNGSIIISVFETIDNRQLLNNIEAMHPKADEWVSTNERGSWYCQVYAQTAFLAF